jgi:uncharacterized ParB-like nuclease family protein
MQMSSKLTNNALKKRNLLKSAGGPGSGSEGQDTQSILKDFKGLEMSPYLTIGKRGEFLETHKPNALRKQIKMDKIKYIIQEKYVPAKVKRMVESSDNLDDLPIDVMVDPQGNYHVLDGHHRFLTAKKKNRHEILANIYSVPAKRQ